MHALSRAAGNLTLVAVGRAALSLLMLTQARGELSAQSAPMVTGRTSMELGPSRSCALAMVGDVAATWDAVRMQLLTPPLTSLGARPASPVAALDLSSTARRSWRVRASGAVGAAEPRCAAQSAWSRGWVEATRTISRGGVALAFGMRSLSSLDPSRDRAGVTASLWQQRSFGRWDIDLRAFGMQTSGMTRFSRTIQRLDSIRSDARLDSTGKQIAPAGWTRYFRPMQVQDSSAFEQQSRQVALRTRWRGAVGRATLDLTAGGTGAFGPATAAQAAGDTLSRSTLLSNPRLQFWARADTRVRLNRYADLLVGVAALPSRPDVGFSAGRVASIGLAFATGARTPPADERGAEGAFEARRLEPAAAVDSGTDSITVRLRLRDDHAQRIEVSGEQFGWKPVTLTRVNAQWWEAEVRMRIGTYRMSIRRDGKRWTAPPGYPALRDEFGSEVGLVTVR